MRQSYLNARKVLPPTVFAALVEVTGGKGTFLWVPASPSLTRSKRDAYVVRLASEGHPAHSIAAELFLSERHVRRILARAKAASLPSAPAPGGLHGNPDLQSKE